MDGESAVLTDEAGDSREYLLLYTVQVQSAEYALAMTDDADPAPAQILRLLPGGRCAQVTDDETRNTVFELFLSRHSDFFEDT